MPYKDPQARRDAVRRSKAKNGATLAKLADAVKGAADLPEPPTRDFLMRALGVQAREGNVPAIRLLLEEYRRDGEQGDKPTRSKIDEIAAKRAERTARAG